MAPSQNGAEIVVMWFKSTDLRVHDHEALTLAHSCGLPVLHLFVFDPRWFKQTPLGHFQRTNSARTQFQLQALRDLSCRLQAAGHSLVVRRGNTASVFAELCGDFKVQAVHASREVCSEELRVEESVRKVLQGAGAGPLKTAWTYELHCYDELPEHVRRKGAGGFSGYRRVFSEQCRIPSPKPEPDLAASAPGVCWERGEQLPSGVQEFGMEEVLAQEERAEVVWEGGESAGLSRVRAYFFDTDAIALHFAGATNFPHDGHSSTKEGSLTKLSPWLSHGCVSPRWLVSELRRYEKERGKTESTARLLHELYFRDFVRFASLRYGNRIFKLDGLYSKHPAGGWLQDQEGIFESWCRGATGFPFVDAAMRELSATGHCCHAGREVAAWFLVADLGLDWRLGAEWFESRLLDYEPAANWFNWAFTCVPRATGGNSIQEEAMPRAPPRTRLQTPEVVYWAAQHDPDAEYIKRWVPELAHLPPEHAREPWRISGTGEVAPRVAGVVEEHPPAPSRERERIGWVRRTFPAGGPEVLVWWSCVREGITSARPASTAGKVVEEERKQDPDDGKSYSLQQLQAKYAKSYSRKDVEEYWQQSCKAVDLRRDPADGNLYSLAELLLHYKDKYSRKEIQDYFKRTCTAPAPAAADKGRSQQPFSRPGPPESWPSGYALPLLPPASLASMEEVAEHSRRNQARKEQKASKLRQERGHCQGQGRSGDNPASAPVASGPKNAKPSRWNKK